MNKEITYKQLHRIIKAANAIPTEDGEKKPYKDTLEKYRLRLSKKMAHVIEDYNDLVEDIENKHCIKSDKGAIQYDKEGRYERTEAHLAARRAEVKELGHKKVFLEPCICLDMTRVNNLPLWIIQDLDGILFNAPKDIVEIPEETPAEQPKL